MNIIHVYTCIYSYIYSYIYIWIYNVKLGLINPAVLINPLCQKKKCYFKNRWSPQINKHFGLPPINKPPVLKSIFLSKSFNWFTFGFLLLYLSWNRVNTRTHHCWSLKIWKNNYSLNDRFLIKFFIKIISLDSSQRVPPMSPCPPLIISMVCPLINQPPCPWCFFFGFAHSFPMSPIAFSQ